VVVVDYEPVCAYEDDDRVEFFSNTHNAWVPAKVDARVVDGTATHEPIVVYDVIIATGRGGSHPTRQDVPLDRLRLPFSHGDLVELYSKRDGGTWLAGMVIGAQGITATRTGYSVHLDESNEVFDDVPAIRLRRRYPADQDILVYRGPREGWHKARVHHTATEDGCNATPIPHIDENHLHEETLQHHSLASLHHEPDAGAMLRRVLQRPKNEDPLARQKGQTEDEEDFDQAADILEQGLWTQVPVDASVDDEHDDFVIVPSFLVRQCFDLRDLGRRQVAL
jgi:hypothetical protein